MHLFHVLTRLSILMYKSINVYIQYNNDSQETSVVVKRFYIVLHQNMYFNYIIIEHCWSVLSMQINGSLISIKLSRKQNRRFSKVKALRSFILKEKTIMQWNFRYSVISTRSKKATKFRSNDNFCFFKKKILQLKIWNSSDVFLWIYPCNEVFVPQVTSVVPYLKS